VQVKCPYHSSFMSTSGVLIVVPLLHFKHWNRDSCKHEKTVDVPTTEQEDAIGRSWYSDCVVGDVAFTFGFCPSVRWALPNGISKNLLFGVTTWLLNYVHENMFFRHKICTALLEQGGPSWTWWHWKPVYDIISRCTLSFSHWKWCHDVPWFVLIYCITWTLILMSNTCLLLSAAQCTWFSLVN